MVHSLYLLLWKSLKQDSGIPIGWTLTMLLCSKTQLTQVCDGATEL